MRKALIALAAVALLGCGGDSTGVNASAVGTWNLQTVSKAPLPYTAVFIANPLYKLEIVSDVFVAHADGTYTETVTTRETNGSTVTTTSEDGTGTWMQNNGAVTVTTSDGESSTGAISGNTITVNNGGLVLVFMRQ